MFDAPFLGFGAVLAGGNGNTASNLQSQDSALGQQGGFPM